MVGWLRGSVGSGLGEEREGRPLVHAAPLSVGLAIPRRVLTSVFFPKIQLDWIVFVPTLCGPDSTPQNTNAACSKVDSLQKNGTCFSFSYPCLSFYFIPIFIPSTLRNKPKQLFNSKDFFTVRWYNGVRCQPRDPRGRCQSPELGSSCQGPTPGGETSRAQDGYPEPERHGHLTPAARLGSYQRPGTLGHSALPMADLQHVNRRSQSPGTASTGTAVTARGPGRTLVF